MQRAIRTVDLAHRVAAYIKCGPQVSIHAAPMLGAHTGRRASARCVGTLVMRRAVERIELDLLGRSVKALRRGLMAVIAYGFHKAV